MFIATTQSPDENITLEQATEDFIHLLGRACEYTKELEKVGKIKKGAYVPLYEKFAIDVKKAVSENWI